MLVFALLFAAQTAVAPASTDAVPAKDGDVVQEPDRVVYRAVTSLEFTGANVDANGEKPSYGLVKARGKTKFRNLIELRSSFRAELKATRDAL